MYNQTHHEKSPRNAPRIVRFTGDTALTRGFGVCYDLAYGTATDTDGQRGHYVAVPNGTNNHAFAGVVAQDYRANVGGQNIEIFEAEEGCICDVAIATAVTINDSILCASVNSVDAGRFSRPGFPGQGAGLALKTVALLASTSATPGVVASSFDGSAQITATSSYKNLVKTGAFTYAAPGDKVVILAGATFATAAAAVTPGVYTIVTKTDNDNVVLDAAPAAAVSAVAFYCIRGNPTVPVRMFGGEQSGLQKTIAPVSGAEVSPAALNGGTNWGVGTMTVSTDSNLTLTALKKGLLKAQTVLVGTLTTKTIKIIPDSGVVIGLPSTYGAATSVKLGTTADFALFAGSPDRSYALLGAVATVA